ncbi:hypothetical protein MA16_Dca027841 [Dendrobium catenatum]|uniref:Uncharacterized protein n=1 Tax=Dendrobium catenatum TaxID=906689 RepID=A0A2I0V9P5_9ASPA|nr:hypothetical protein MA16_Dca027841 [Dendrobium catenatum]
MNQKPTPLLCFQNALFSRGKWIRHQSPGLSFFRPWLIQKASNLLGECTLGDDGLKVGRWEEVEEEVAS